MVAALRYLEYTRSDGPENSQWFLSCPSFVSMFPALKMSVERGRVSIGLQDRVDGGADDLFRLPGDKGVRRLVSAFVEGSLHSDVPRAQISVPRDRHKGVRTARMRVQLVFDKDLAR